MTSLNKLTTYSRLVIDDDDNEEENENSSSTLLKDIAKVNGYKEQGDR